MDFETLSDNTIHDPDTFDITDFMLWNQSNSTIQHASVKYLDHPPSSKDTFFDIKEFTKSKDKYLKEIATHLNNFQEEKQKTKESLKKLILSLKSTQEKLTRFPEDPRAKFELISISELIRRLRNVTCFPLDQKHLQCLKNIMANDSYRRLKFETISEVKKLTKTVKDKMGVWCELDERKKLENFDKKLKKLQAMLQNKQEIQIWQDEKDVLELATEAFSLFAGALRTNAHEEEYRELATQLNMLENDKDRYRTHLVATAS